jgi:hypothetical protein
MEGLGNITAQGNITCTSNTLPSNIYTVVTTDISNIQLLYNEVNTIGNQAITIITKSNSNPSNTSVTVPTLNTIPTSTTTLTQSSNASDYCIAINQNVTNINLISETIQNIINAIQKLQPNGQTEINNAVFQSLTSNTTVSPNSPASSVPISTLCQTENTNISNINVLSANTTSLNNVVTNLQSAQNNQLNNQNSTAMAMSKPVGLTSN